MCIVGDSEYFGQTIVFGKGKSETTVYTPDIIVAQGEGVLVKGTVLDLSPAQSGTPSFGTV